MRIVAHQIALAAMLAAATITVSAAASQTEMVLDEREALRISQAAIGRTLKGYEFRDTERRVVKLADFRGKPLILQLIYTSCYHSCPLAVQNLDRSVEAAAKTFGGDAFAVVTIGFDYRSDTPERLRAFATDQGINRSNWQFLAGSPEAIDRLIADVGFVFAPSPRGFDHLAQTTIVDAEGVVFRQVYGSDIDVPGIVEPLKALLYGRTADYATVAGLINRLKLFCTIYDPRSERYRFDYSIFIGIAVGGLILSTMAVILARAIYREYRGGRNA